jgi:hypothetical protein
LPRLRLLLSRLVLPMCQRYSSTTDFQDSRGKLCVIIFIGNFVRSSDMGHEGSIIEKQCRLFGELGACLCSPDFDLGCRSLASLVEFVQRAGARTDYWTAPTLATGKVLGLYPRARRLCAWPVFCVATVKALGEDHQTTC